MKVVMMVVMMADLMVHLKVVMMVVMKADLLVQK